MDRFWINDELSHEYGVSFTKGAYKALRVPADVKWGVVNNWSDQHGTERDLEERFLESRKLEIPIMLAGTDEDDYDLKYHAFFEGFLIETGYFFLKVEKHNRIYKLVYSGVTDFQDFDDHCTCKLVLTDDFPQIKTPIA